LTGSDDLQTDRSNYLDLTYQQTDRRVRRPSGSASERWLAGLIAAGLALFLLVCLVVCPSLSTGDARRTTSVGVSEDAPSYGYNDPSFLDYEVTFEANEVLGQRRPVVTATRASCSPQQDGIYGCSLQLSNGQRKTVTVSVSRDGNSAVIESPSLSSLIR
jgi:hypothetical protein